MDLGTVKKGIENGKYETVEVKLFYLCFICFKLKFCDLFVLIDSQDIANDIRLVWSNCMLYNRDGSEVNNPFVNLYLLF